MIETKEAFSSEDSSVVVTKSTAGVKIKTAGQLGVQLVPNQADGGSSHVSIYGDSAGLLALADLLTAFAKIDQKSVHERNCPAREGIHTTLDEHRGLTSNDIQLHIGRIDAKRDGDQTWFRRNDSVTIIDMPDTAG